MTADLITRLEEAESGSRELDAEVCLLLDYGRRPHDTHWSWSIPDGFVESSYPRPLTTSIDAAVALIREKLPGSEWSLQCFINGKVQASIWLDEHCEVCSEEVSTAPVALVIALLRALGGPGHGS